jgi:hypothetical protein
VQAVRFEIPPCPLPEVQALRRELGVSAAMAQVLVRRGHGDPAGARAFLAASEEHSPARFEGIELAVAVILARIRAGGRITVHGDYDVDGICSTAVLVRALRGLGADVDTFIPDRAAGYGLQRETVRALAARGTRLLITADCAITAVEEVRSARELGLEVVVTDHHSTRRSFIRPSAATRAASCARRRSPTSSRRRCSKPPARMTGRLQGSRAIWTSSPSRRSRTSCRCSARTVRCCAAACGRSPPPPSRGCAR